MTQVALGIPGVRRPGQGPAVTEQRPDDHRLVDRYGRVSTDLRVSLTDRCNLRCGYCMPPEGLDWAPTEQQLTDAELVRLLRLAVQRLGVREVRFTGGEPLLRRGLEDLVAATSALRTADGALVSTSLTTNGLGLARRAGALAAAGLSRVNVSLDTVRPEVFAAITRRDRLADVLVGARAAADAGLTPVKVNAVLLPGVNDAHAAELLTWALGEGYQLRFIEQMPLDAQGGWQREAMVTADQVLELLAAEYDLHPSGQPRGSAPAQTWTVHHRGAGASLGEVGIVASVTRPFCGDCDRARLTADGQVRSCLFSRTETDLRTLLRAGAGDDELVAAWQGEAWAKLPGHGIDDPGFLQPDRPMSSIGG